MKKTSLLGSALSAIAGVGLLAGGAFALPATPVLQDQLDLRTLGGTSSVDVQTEMLADSLDSAWAITATGGSVNAIILEFAGWMDTTSFGIYDLSDPTNTLEIFTGADTATPPLGGTATLEFFAGAFSVDSFTTSVAFGSGKYFGYYLDVAATGNTYYSDTGLNADGYDHMFAYQGEADMFSIYNDGNYATWTPQEYILAWEDQFGGGDQDFTDFVVMVESVEPVPEPATMLLFGTGLAGLAGISRRRKK